MILTSSFSVITIMFMHLYERKVFPKPPRAGWLSEEAK